MAPSQLQGLQMPQGHAPPAPWAQTFQPQPQPEQLVKTADPFEEKELEYRNARCEQLDNTLVHFLRAARSSDMSRLAILETMNGVRNLLSLRSESV